MVHGGGGGGGREAPSTRSNGTSTKVHGTKYQSKWNQYQNIFLNDSQHFLMSRSHAHRLGRKSRLIDHGYYSWFSSSDTLLLAVAMFRVEKNKPVGGCPRLKYVHYKPVQSETEC